MKGKEKRENIGSAIGNLFFFKERAFELDILDAWPKSHEISGSIFKTDEDTNAPYVALKF
jgi:hypothetical protein